MPIDIFDLVGKVHYDTLITNSHYREAFDPNSKTWTQEEIEKFKAYLKKIDNKGTND